MTVQERAFDADVVIVGAGSAGAVLAGRLSEDPSLQIVLLEAGTRSGGFLAEIPGMTMQLYGNPATDWLHQAVPDPGMNNRTVIWNAGKMLGGGSSINGMVYIRGLKRDFDDWGCAGWSWEDVTRHFQRAEGFDGEGAASIGRGGPLAVSHIRSVHPLSQRFVEACAETGLPTLADYNNGGGEGAFLNLTNQRRGRRASTASSYLRPAAGRGNLRVLRGARVDRVVVENGRAQAVRFIQGGVVREVRARREIIISAGTLQSPTILMRSGIGAGEVLRGHGIAVAADRPEVGQNLQEQSGIMVTKMVNIPTYNSEMDPINGLRHLFNYLLFRRGPLSSPVVQAMAFMRSDPSFAEPDLCLNWFPYGVDFNATPPAMHTRPAVGLGASLCRPRSRGHGGHGLHSVGTCRMGADAASVVDLDLNVRGVAGLRVADASIMPRIVSANTNAASIMIGERAATIVQRALSR